MVTGCLLLVGNIATDWLGLEEHRAWISLAFIVSLAILIAQLMSLAWNLVSNAFCNYWELRLLRRRLHSLTLDETNVIRRFLLQRNRSHVFAANDAAVVSLAHAKVIEQKDEPDYHLKATFVIAEWAWDYANKNPNRLLGVDPANLAADRPWEKNDGST